MCVCAFAFLWVPNSLLKTCRFSLWLFLTLEQGHFKFKLSSISGAFFVSSGIFSYLTLSHSTESRYDF